MPDSLINEFSFTLFGAGLILVLRVLHISLATVRTLATNQRLMATSSLIGLVESLAFVLPMGLVMQDITNFWNIGAYCGGFALGNFVGIALERRIGLGFSQVRIVSVDHADHLADELRRQGMGATLSRSEGRTGAVGVVECVVPSRTVSRVRQLAMSVDPGAFYTVATPHDVQGGWRPRNENPLSIHSLLQFPMMRGFMSRPAVAVAPQTEPSPTAPLLEQPGA